MAKEYRDNELVGRLTPEEFRVLRRSSTERPFSSELNGETRKGFYHCKVCDTALFAHSAKFDSGCGWPSFDREIEGARITRIKDTSHSMIRVEIRCAECDSHLGHVFPDGPTDTGLRYCVNSLSVKLEKSED